MSSQPQKSPNGQTLYFAYGSNLSLHQMKTRCPTSPYHSFGILRDFRWIISQRGYANVVSNSKSAERGENNGEEGEEAKGKNGDGEDEAIHWVEGLLYTLSTEDEERLDIAEGVPFAYEKFWLDVEVFHPSNVSYQNENQHPSLNLGDRFEGELKGQEGIEKEKKTVKALVYVDLQRTASGVCKEEYVARMNRGVRDAKGLGMSDRYINHVIRKWVPDVKLPDDDGEVKDPFAPPER